MARRPTVRVADLRSAVEALKQAGMEPSALDIMPDGTHRWHFTKPATTDDDLDRELAEFDKKHGHG